MQKTSHSTKEAGSKGKGWHASAKGGGRESADTASATYRKHLSSLPKEDMDWRNSSLWLRFNIEEEDAADFRFNPEQEVGGGGVVSLVLFFWIKNNAYDMLAASALTIIL